MAEDAASKPPPATRPDLPPPLREPRGGSSPLIRTLKMVLLLVAAAMTAAVCLSGDVLGASRAVPTTEVVVTLKGAPLAGFGRTLQSTSHASYARQLAAAQNELARRVQSAVPSAQVRWRYRLVADGFAVVVPRSEVAKLAHVPGVDRVWPNVRYHALRAAGGPEQIGADKLWGPAFETAGNGMKIGIIDDGLDASNPYFDPSGFQYPPGFPKGHKAATTAKVIVQRTFAPASPAYKYANTPFDPTGSFHATHVAGIAAGNHGTNAKGVAISGVAPNAQLGNYKALTIPSPDFGLDGNSAEIAAAIEAAVADGMNVINLSLGEPEIEPQRDLVVQAIDAAAAAGVVPVVAAGNDFDQFGYGSVSSPGSAPGAITVAAVDAGDQIAGFSSAGPTPVSLAMKPDVAAPGVSILSSLPANTFGLLSGTSMASPHVAGAAALLKERHPEWTVEQIKSALEQSGDPAHTASGSEALAMREGGGVIDLPRADVPLIFASPTGLSFGRLGQEPLTQTVTLTDAGGGAGVWSVSAVVQSGAGSVVVPATVTVPGSLAAEARPGSEPGDVTGFIVLTRGTDVRRIPFWFAVSARGLANDRFRSLAKPGTYSGTTVGGDKRVATYRYPTGGDVTYPGPERVYRVAIKGSPANFGVAVLSGHAVPHVVIGTSEDHLAGYPGLPLDLNPYRTQYGARRLIAGAVLPASGVYEIVFDTRSAATAGPFSFRYWVNDVTPPTLKLLGTQGEIRVAAADAGSGVDPLSIAATVDGKVAKVKWRAGTISIGARSGRHALVLRVSDYQETKNMEDVPPILPNTRTLRLTVRVR
jgi:subtilisin family serine protease